MRGEKPETDNPPNSEVSELFLRSCAGTPAVVKDMQLALKGKWFIPKDSMWQSATRL